MATGSRLAAVSAGLKSRGEQLLLLLLTIIIGVVTVSRAILRRYDARQQASD